MNYKILTFVFSVLFLLGLAFTPACYRAGRVTGETTEKVEEGAKKVKETVKEGAKDFKEGYEDAHD